jgi:hypothetical protein
MLQSPDATGGRINTLPLEDRHISPGMIRADGNQQHQEELMGWMACIACFMIGFLSALSMEPNPNKYPVR